MSDPDENSNDMGAEEAEEARVPDRGGQARNKQDFSWLHEPEAEEEATVFDPARPDAGPDGDGIADSGPPTDLEPPVLEPVASPRGPELQSPETSPEPADAAPGLAPFDVTAPEPTPPPTPEQAPAAFLDERRFGKPESQPPAALPAIADLMARARGEEDTRSRYQSVVEDVQRHLDRGYDLIGLVGISGSGKSHLLKALSLLLKMQGFEVADWEKLRRRRVPALTEATVFDYPASGPNGEKWVFVDAGGELYARLQLNDWDLAEDSAALLHSLYSSKALFLLLHLQPGHFRLGAAGSHRWMSEEEEKRDVEIQKAQEELEFFDLFLLFVRGLMAEEGRVQELMVRCAEEGLDKALRRYRDQAPKLDIPIQVLFTQADTLGDGGYEVAEAIHLSPRKSTMGVASFVARRLPTLMGTLLAHARRFRFDFVQSYEERRVLDSGSAPHTVPEWQLDEELLSCGALSALEFLVRNLPATSASGRVLQRLELTTRQALRLDRWIHRRRWKGIEVQL